MSHFHSCGNFSSPAAKPRATRVSSGKKPAASMDCNSLQGMACCDRDGCQIAMTQPTHHLSIVIPDFQYLTQEWASVILVCGTHAIG